MGTAAAEREAKETEAVIVIAAACHLHLPKSSPRDPRQKGDQKVERRRRPKIVTAWIVKRLQRIRGVIYGKETVLIMSKEEIARRMSTVIVVSATTKVLPRSQRLHN